MLGKESIVPVSNGQFIRTEEHEKNDFFPCTECQTTNYQWVSPIEAVSSFAIYLTPGKLASTGTASFLPSMIDARCGKSGCVLL